MAVNDGRRGSGFSRPAERDLGLDGADLRAARRVRVDLERAEDEPLLGVDAHVPAPQREAVLVEGVRWTR